MPRLINARAVHGQLFGFSVEGGFFKDVFEQIELVSSPSGSLTLDQAAQFARLPDEAVVDARGETILPAALDVHVHSREPGLAHKETWQTLARGAWRGGVIAVADMPNTLPPTMTREAVVEKARIASASGLQFSLLLGVGAGNINDIAELLSDPSLPVCALKVFYGRTTGELMYDDLETLSRALPADGSKLVVFHSEDQCTVDCNQQRFGGELRRRENPSFLVHSKIRSSEAAHLSTRTILEWGKSYGRPIHIAHVSTPVEIEMIAEAKSHGVNVSSEVAPHHLLFSTDDYERLGPLVKMNPPLRTPAELEALRKLVGQGAVDIFASDHAPHTLAEKQAEVGKCPSGVPALELFYPLVFECARVCRLDAQTAVRMSSANPARLFGFQHMGEILPGKQADFVWLSKTSRCVGGSGHNKKTTEEVVSKCGWTPYDGLELPCDVLGTWNRGNRVY